MDNAAIEVKNGHRRAGLPRMEAFLKEFKVKRKLLVGSHGILLEKFIAFLASWDRHPLIINNLSLYDKI